MKQLKIIETVPGMQSFSDAAKAAGKTVGCVPTMGYLHEGHCSLIRECAKRTNVVVMTLFVNPTQFAPGEDLEKYPRDFEGDCAKAREAGADAVFYPSVSEMYPEGYQTYVCVEELSRELEGAHRPTHFRGVATVVAKLFAAVRPGVAVFGEKDYQQLLVIRRMAADLHLGVLVVGMPTVREQDGMAMSSRNVYLSPEERERARSISRALFTARDEVEKGGRDAGALVEKARKTIAESGLVMDYVEIRGADDLSPVAYIKGPARMLAAARVGKTRLIDNIGLAPAG